MTKILRFILFFLLAPTFAIVVQAAGTFQDDSCIVDTSFRTESVVLGCVVGENCYYDSRGALLQQRKSIDGRDDLSQYLEFKTSWATQPLHSFLAEFVAAKGADTLAPLPSNPKQYSSAFEMKLDPSDFGKSDSVHFNRANKALDDALNADPQFAATMENLIPGVRNAVSSKGGAEQERVRLFILTFLPQFVYWPVHL